MQWQVLLQCFFVSLSKENMTYLMTVLFEGLSLNRFTLFGIHNLGLLFSFMPPLS